MNKILFFISCFTLLSNAYAQEVSPPHIGPEGGQFNHLYILQVEKMIENQLASKDLSAPKAADTKKLEMLLAVGKKASKWVAVVNTTRSPDAQLDLSTGSVASGGSPITKPMKTSTDILMKRYQDFLQNSSTLITDIITSSQELPINPGVSDEEFIKSLKVLDNIYQATIRWSGAQQWISWYANRSIYDVRGYMFLKELPDREVILNSFPNLSIDEKEKLGGWLLNLCKNGDFELSDCVAELNSAIMKNRVLSYYTRFNKYGKSMYDLFFTVKKTRPEIKWNTGKTILNSPFQKPQRVDVHSWLKANVQDEWKGLNFNLNIDYQVSNADIPRIQFKEGVTANVNGIAGNLITMESSYPIENISQKWTIRHEFGHVLGFEDCYLEFYDAREKAMIYYEIEVDNLMCSRSGRLKPIHIQQLQSAYK